MFRSLENNHSAQPSVAVHCANRRFSKNVRCYVVSICKEISCATALAPTFKLAYIVQSRLNDQHTNDASGFNIWKLQSASLHKLTEHRPCTRFMYYYTSNNLSICAHVHYLFPEIMSGGCSVCLQFGETAETKSKTETRATKYTCDI